MNNKFLYLAIITFLFAGAHVVHAQIITTLVGTGYGGSVGDNGPAISCELKQPYSIAVDASGNLYIADQGNNRIRKVNTSDIITTIAGNGLAGYSGDYGAATNAKLDGPSGVAVDASGNVYISDNYNHRIRKVDGSGIITTVAGTGSNGYNGDGMSATAAELYSPHGIAVDATGNLYICDVLNNRLRKVNTAGIITTIAGTGLPNYSGDGGQATATDIGQPFGVAIDKSGTVFFADLSSNRVCQVNTSGVISTIAGTGTYSYNGDNIIATSAELSQPFDVAVDNNGNIYIADLYNYRIRKVNTAGIITTVAGTGISGSGGDGGPAAAAEISDVPGIALDAAGSLYLADNGNFKIRYVRNAVFTPLLNTAIECLNVYPNPSNTGSFTLNVVSSSPVNEIQIVITDIMGRKIKEVTAIANKPLKIQFDRPDGVYFLSAHAGDGNGYVMRRIVVRK